MSKLNYFGFEKYIRNFILESSETGLVCIEGGWVGGGLQLTRLVESLILCFQHRLSLPHSSVAS